MSFYNCIFCNDCSISGSSCSSTCSILFVGTCPVTQSCVSFFYIIFLPFISLLHTFLFLLFCTCFLFTCCYSCYSHTHIESPAPWQCLTWTASATSRWIPLWWSRSAVWQGHCRTLVSGRCLCLSNGRYLWFSVHSCQSSVSRFWLFSMPLLRHLFLLIWFGSVHQTPVCRNRSLHSLRSVPPSLPAFLLSFPRISRTLLRCCSSRWYGWYSVRRFKANRLWPKKYPIWKTATLPVILTINAWSTISLMILLLQLRSLQRILPKPLMMLILTNYFLCGLLYYDCFPYGVLGSATIDSVSWLFRS